MQISPFGEVYVGNFMVTHQQNHTTYHSPIPTQMKIWNCLFPFLYTFQSNDLHHQAVPALFKNKFLRMKSIEIVPNAFSISYDKFKVLKLYPMLSVYLTTNLL